MGRAPCCSKVGLHRGPWTSKEDSLLTNYITSHGEGHWRSLPKQAGLLRCGKSCRLRWMNYLRPDIKRGNITAQEDDLIIRLHSLLGNRWSLIAGRLPGRTDNEIKNYWNTRLSKKITPPNSTRSPSKNSITIKRKSPNKKANSASSPPADLEIIETKHMVHQPKPVRLGSVRNISSLVQTSESNNNNNSTNIECSSYSSENNMNLNSNYYYYYNNNSNSCSSEEGDKQQVDHHVADLEVAALYNNNNIGSSNDIIGAWDDDDDVYNGLYGDQAFNAVNNNNTGGVWEKLYEEYLQLTSDGCEVESQHPHEASLFI